MITFDFRPEKFLNAVAYLGKRCPGTTKKKICKLLYFADKEHLLQYGRPITGDTYYRLPHGPIPTQGLDLLNGKGSLANLAVRDKFFEIDGWDVRVKRDFEPPAFSKSELRVLENVCRAYGKLPAHELERLSHEEPAWVKTPENDRIDFALFFENCPEAEVAKRIAEGESHDSKLLAPYRASR